MKRLLYLTGLLTFLLSAGAGAQQKPAAVQQLFASPQDAVKTLQTAVNANDKTALNEIFGPQLQMLMTGDEVQDANNRQKFAAAMAQGYTLVQDGEDKITIEVGRKNWPMPVPLMKANGLWYFDTAAGKEEIINRHIGKDELNAIGVCRAYVAAQQRYADMNPQMGKEVQYAQRFSGLASPFKSLVAQACAEGYCGRKGPAPHPLHGYYFRIMTKQGKAAPGGKMDYMSHGKLSRGFALVAYPVRWDQSGIMTFIVDQDGKVYQRNIGEKTSLIAGAMKDYDPDSRWTLVQDQGEVDTASAK